MGVGNPLARDDGVGVWVAERFRKEGWLSVPVRQAPENFIGKLRKLAPELTVVVDAVEMGLEPGEIRRIPLREDRALWGSTHSLPLPSFFVHVPGRVVFVGIQPKELSLGEGLSPEVEAGARRLLELLSAGDLGAIPELEGGRG